MPILGSVSYQRYCEKWNNFISKKVSRFFHTIEDKKMKINFILLEIFLVILTKLKFKNFLKRTQIYNKLPIALFIYFFHSIYDISKLISPLILTTVRFYLTILKRWVRYVKLATIIRWVVMITIFWC